MVPAPGQSNATNLIAGHARFYWVTAIKWYQKRLFLVGFRQNRLASRLFNISHGPTVAESLHLFQNQLNSSVLVVGRIFVFAQDALDHQPQLGLHAFSS